jgi:hypothetical protein
MHDGIGSSSRRGLALLRKRGFLEETTTPISLGHAVTQSRTSVTGADDQHPPL